MRWHARKPPAWAALCMGRIFRWQHLKYESQTSCWNMQKIFSTNISHRFDGKRFIRLLCAIHTHINHPIPAHTMSTDAISSSFQLSFRIHALEDNIWNRTYMINLFLYIQIHIHRAPTNRNLNKPIRCDKFVKVIFKCNYINVKSLFWNVCLHKSVPVCTASQPVSNVMKLDQLNTLAGAFNPVKSIFSCIWWQ